MKKVYLVIVFMLSLAFAKAQTQEITAQKQEPAVAMEDMLLKQGDIILNGSIGLGWGFQLKASGDYVLADKIADKGAITGGAYLAYSSFFLASSFQFGAKADFHYQFAKKLDTYAGLSAGYGIVSGTLAGYGVGFPDYDIHLGARYFFNESWAMFTELGYGTSIFKLGVSYKL